MAVRFSKTWSVGGAGLTWVVTSERPVPITQSDHAPVRPCWRPRLPFHPHLALPFFRPGMSHSLVMWSSKSCNILQYNSVRSQAKCVGQSYWGTMRQHRAYNTQKKGLHLWSMMHLWEFRLLWVRLAQFFKFCLFLCSHQGLPCWSRHSSSADVRRHVLLIPGRHGG